PTGSGIVIKTPASSNGAAVSIGNGYTAVVVNNGSSIFLNNLQLPLKPFAAQPITLTMTVDVPCTVNTTTWTASMSTGATGTGGQPFMYVDSDGKGNSSSPKTPVSGICGSIAFVAGSQPANAFASTATTTSMVTTVPFSSGGAQVQVVVKANNVPVSGVT